MATNSEPWYSVRCILRLDEGYEERTTVWLADDFDSAIALVESEAREDAEDLDAEYLGLAQAFHPATSDLLPGVEVFSLIRQSDLEPDDYMSAFFDTGTELQRNVFEAA